MQYNHVTEINHIFGARVFVAVFVGIGLACSSPGGEPPENSLAETDCDDVTPSTCVSQASEMMDAGQASEAVALLVGGCERSHAPSCRVLGVWKRDDRAGTDVVPDRAVSLLFRADVGGDVEGAYELGVSYRDGLTVDVDVQRASVQFESGCSRDHARSCYDLGMLLTQGPLPVDTEKAGRAFMVACGLNNGSSCWNASSLAEQGLYTPYGDHTAASLKVRACELGAEGACGS